MPMGRHRALLASMKDQEVIELSAVDLLNRRREKSINNYEEERLEEIESNCGMSIKVTLQALLSLLLRVFREEKSSDVTTGRVACL
jgi:hypothetical protein